MDASTILKQLILIALLTLVNAFFAASEMAIVSTNKKKIQIKADGGDKNAKRLLKTLSEPARFLSTIQVGITFASFFSSASAAVGISEDLGKVLTDANVPFGKNIAFIGVTLILSYIILVFGELVPKRIGLQDSERFSMIAIKPINLFAKVMKPFVSFLSFSTNAIMRLLGFSNIGVEEKVTLEEIRSLVEVGQEQGVINALEKEMIESVITFDDKVAKEIMTARTEIFMIDIDEFTKDKRKEMINLKFSRIPVYRDSADNIIGMLYLKDYLLEAFNVGFEGIDLEHILRKPYFVPEHKNINNLFLELQRTRNHFAILIDEYGGVSGIVTMEDLIEEIMGDIDDEYDYEEPEIEKVSENIYHARGRTSIKDINSNLDLKLEDDLEYYDTLGGLLTHILGYIPKSGQEEIIRYKNVEFQILEIKRHKIRKVKITILDDKKV